MKKLFFVVLVLVVMCASVFAAWKGDWNKWQKVDVSVFPEYKPLSEAKVDVPKATGTITIDGQPAEADWKNSAVININEDEVEDWQQFGTHVTVGSPPDSADDFSAKVYMLYDSQNIYFFYVIADKSFDSTTPNRWQNDSIEQFYDADLQKVAPLQKYFGAVNFDDNSDIEASQLPNTKIKRGRWEKGYTVEFNVLASDIKATLPPLDGKTIGWDTQLDNNDKGTPQSPAMNWAGGQNQDYLTAQYYGQLHFVK